MAPARRTADVTRGTLEVSAKVTSGSVVVWNTGGYQPWETIYVTYSTPIGVIDQPWTDLLDYACTWANGKSNNADVQKEVTNGYYFSGSYPYEGAGSFGWDHSNNSYRLKDVLNFPGTILNCADVAGFVNLALLALGVTARCARLEEDSFDYSTFVTNELCPAGKNPLLDANYESYGFVYHQVTLLGFDDTVCDTTTAHKRDLLGLSYRKPPANWPIGPYWQTQQTPGAEIGLVIGYYLPGIGIVRGLVPRKTLVKNISAVK